LTRRSGSLFATLLFLFASTVAPANASEALVDLGEPGALMLPMPRDWTHEIGPADGDVPPTIILQAPNADTVVLVTPFWAHEGAEPDYGTAGSVHRVVERSAAEIAPGAVEDRLTIEPIGGGRIGFMFFATDKSLVGRTPAPDEYRYLIQGAVMVGDLLCTFTVLTNDKPSADAELALEMLRNAAHRTGT
jgi:hypothetical protein